MYDRAKEKTMNTTTSGIRTCEKTGILYIQEVRRLGGISSETGLPPRGSVRTKELNTIWSIRRQGTLASLLLVVVIDVLLFDKASKPVDQYPQRCAISSISIFLYCFLTLKIQPFLWVAGLIKRRNCTLSYTDVLHRLGME
jgi:hypothetical protein